MNLMNQKNEMNHENKVKAQKNDFKNVLSNSTVNKCMRTSNINIIVMKEFLSIDSQSSVLNVFMTTSEVGEEEV